MTTDRELIDGAFYWVRFPAYSNGPNKWDVARYTAITVKRPGQEPGVWTPTRGHGQTWFTKDFDEIGPLIGKEPPEDGGPLSIATKALDDIASWSEGPHVNGSFDEPGSASMARRALAEMRGEKYDDD